MNGYITAHTVSLVRDGVVHAGVMRMAADDQELTARLNEDKEALLNIWLEITATGIADCILKMEANHGGKRDAILLILQRRIEDALAEEKNSSK
jgi:hypothetical protein